MEMIRDPRSLPDVRQLLQRLGDDLRREPGGWLLAGVAALIVSYAIPILAFVLLAVLLVPAFALARDAAGYSVVVALLVAVLAAGAIGPFAASLYRAARDHVHGVPLSFAAPFQTAGRDLGAAVAVTLTFGLLVGLGTLLFVVPGLIVAWLLMWAPPLVFLHRRSLGEALSGSVQLATRAPGWTLLLALLGVVASAIAGAIPVVGPILLVPVVVLLHARAFEAAFGEEPIEARPYVSEREGLPPGPPIEV